MRGARTGTRRVVIRGRAMTTPKALPTETRVYCARCDRSYEVTRDELLLTGFVCDCGALRMPPRFEVRA